MSHEKVASYISGPRWAGLREFLVDAANATGVDLASVETERGWLRETVYFEVRGERAKLCDFDALFRSAIR